jgi:pimeloyl-ACP methyl ester carboxylesterase
MVSRYGQILGENGKGGSLMGISSYHPFRSKKAREEYFARYDMRAKIWPVFSESVMVKTSYGRTFVRISGPVDGPPLVLLPGAGATSLIWYPNIKALSASCRVYAVDSIYDYGRSLPVRTFKSADELVDCLNDLLGALGLEDKINLMGLSYGGWLASRYALCFPERINKIVLLAPAATFLPLRAEFQIRAILMALPFRFFTKSFMFWVLEDFVQKNEASRTMVDQTVDDMWVARRCYKTRGFVNPTVLKDEELRNIKVPALFLVGENEKIYSARKAIQRVNSVAPHIKSEIILDAGHDLAIVQAEMVNKKVSEFLKQ